MNTVQRSCCHICKDWCIRSLEHKTRRGGRELGTWIHAEHKVCVVLPHTAIWCQPKESACKSICQQIICAGMGITIRCEDHCLAIIRHVHLEALEVENHLKLSALLYQGSLLDWDSKLLQNYKLKFCQSRGCRWKLKKNRTNKMRFFSNNGKRFSFTSALTGISVSVFSCGSSSTII